jgi:glycosyltransferase involved in cell wall biosynthesis
MAKVSVVIPFYNRIDWLVEAVQSVLNQSFSDFELILVDDGSDQVLPVEFIESDRRIRYIRQKNQGPAAARNAGIDATSSEYIAFLDSDDVFFPNKLERQLDLMDRNPTITLSHTSYFQMGANGDSGELVPSGIFSGIVYPDLIKSCPIATPTVVLRRSAIGNNLRFNEKIRIGEDILFWIDLTLSNHMILGINEPLTKVRLHGHNAAYDPQSQINFHFLLIDMVLNGNYPIPFFKHQEIQSTVFLNIANQYFLMQKRDQYYRWLVRAFFCWPLNPRFFDILMRRIKKVWRKIIEAF